MTPLPDPRARARLRLGVAALLALGAAAAAIRWAAAPIAATLPPPPEAPSVAANAVRAPLDLRAWDVPLWQRLRDEPPPPPPPPAPLQVKLIGIVHGSGAPSAMLDAGKDGLRRVRVGDLIQGWRVAAIDATGVDLVRNDQRQRLGLGA